MKCIAIVILALAIAFASVSLVGITATSSAETSAQSEFVPNEVIVGFNEKVTKGKGASTIQKYGGTLLVRNDALNSVLVRVEDEHAFINEISRAPAVKYAERNGIVYALAPKAKKMSGDSTRDYTPNDPRWDDQWGPQSIKCPGAWQTEHGSIGVIIAIVDTGIDYNHEDLTHYVTGGYDFVNYDNDPWDDAGHGTHCAGIAAATMDNAIGISGVAQAGIMAEKVLNAGGSGTAFGVSQGITHATDFGADVISMSLGSSGHSAEVANACQYGWDAGAILVAASGNDGMAPVSYPAWYDTVICVGSIGQSDLVSGFSNYGTKMELVAPGEDIISTMPGDTYAYKRGTSMATPHVAGVAALVLSHYPSWTNSDVRANLQATAVDSGSTGWDQHYGYGKVDANTALLLLPYLSLEKSGDPDTVQPGGTINYSIIVNNYGYAAATNVTVTETYDTNVTFDSAVPAPSSGNDTWILPLLDANESTWINISVSVNPSTQLGTVLHNIVNVTCAEGATDSDAEATTVFLGEQNCTCGDICVIRTGWWRNGGAFHPSDRPIQAAIDTAIPSDTICVKDGTYNENVDVNKRLTLKSENGAASTTVNALYSNDHVFEVTADYVNISGFSVRGAAGGGKAGIYLGSNIDHCNISTNNASDNYYGIYMSWSSNNNTITSNIAFNSNCGIYLSSSSSNAISDNTASNNNCGIYLSSSSSNTISDNTASDNDWCGIFLEWSSNNNMVTGNTASSNDYGIFMHTSCNNNHIYNNYFNNKNNAQDNGNNIWNLTKTTGLNIIGGSWLGGNYWSDYAGIDANGDGLGDTLLPYNDNGDILIGGDMHPLVPVGFAPLLSLKKSDDPDPVSPGGTINYSISVNNVGFMTTTNVTVTETYDANVSFDSAMPAPSTGNDMWIFPALNTNETKWINISVIVNPSTPIGTVLHNIVKVSCDQDVTDTDTEATTVFSGEQNCKCGDICVITTGWWRDGGTFHPTDTPIQDAIDNAGTGDTICVKDGTYTENVDVDKRLTIRSDNGAASTTVNALYPTDPVFEVTADYVSISGFAVKGAIGGGEAGIYLGSNIDHCNIYDNHASDNYYGIYLSWSSNNNTISGNTVSYNDQNGIYLEWSSNNTVTSNNIALNNNCGIDLTYSSSNTISDNTASNNGWCGIYLSSSSSNTISDNTASSNNYGIYLYSSSNNTMHSNTASSNGYGIRLYSSCNNNHIYNNYFDNKNNAQDDGNNIWNITKTAGLNIISGSWLGGNYWSVYAGIDANGDGLGDTLLPYNANGNILTGGDMHPLVPAGFAPLLSLEKSDYSDPVPPGGTINYSIIVNNVGYITTTNVIVTETYDVNVIFDSAMPAPSGGNNVWIFPALNANETKWINISVIVNPSTPIGTVLHNIVKVSCDQGVTDTDTEATTVFSGEQNCTCGDICVITTGWWRDGGAFHASNTPIQDAIDNTGTGDTICVKDGTYNENVDVNKRLTLKSDNGAAYTTVNVLYPNDHVFEVTADYVSISGFTVKGATGKGKAGIYLSSSIDHCNIYDNHALDNNYGIYVMESSNNKITSNTVSYNDRYGIYLRRESSNYNTITNNIALNNNYGLYLSSSSSNTISNNTASNNDRYGIYLRGSSNYNTITSNIALNNDYGIRLSHSSNNTIHSNTASSNDYGIDLYSSSNNNRIYNNYFNNFQNNVRDDGNNIWNITKTAGTNIIGGSWLGGNYWSDYAGIDANGDGLGDTLLPYNANGDILIGGDMHPLVPAGIAPLLSLEKSDNPDPVSPSGRLNYSISVNNVGHMTTTNVIVTETYDANVTFDSAMPAPSVGNNVWIFPALNVNETKWINISVIVNPSTPIGTVLHNIVNATSAEGVTDSDTEATTVFSGEQNCTCGDICVVTTGWWRDGGSFNPSDTPIQDAIDNAGVSDTICVKDGTYTENLDVDKRLTIRSENGAASTTVNALYPNEHVFEVTADYVSISGFTVRGAISGGEAGIYLGSNIDHCNISDNNASGNSIGIYTAESSNYNSISGNTVSNNDQNGIYLEWSSNYNTITSNIALNNNYGIYLYSSSSNTISGNTASNNGWYGIYLSGSSNNNSITSNIALNNNYGLYLYSSSSNTIHSNTASSNGYGIRLSSSSSNTISDNTALNNKYGIHLYSSSSNNHIYNNYFNNTQDNARDDGSNIWNIIKTAGPNIIGGSWLGGNYWSDYAGIDANGDGLGDTLLPYNSNGDIIIGGDMHPLVPIGFAPLLSLEKSDNPDPVPAGGTLNYSIIVSNNGFINASAVTVTETYDVNVTFDSAMPAPSSGNDMWTFPALNANESKWINISVTVNPSIPIGTVLHNIVNATSAEGVTDYDTEATTVFSGVQNCTCGDICVITTGWWRDGSAFQPTDTPIQDAIDNAGTGDTICVKDGTYNENVDVDTRLTIRSDNGAASTTVNALYLNEHVFEVTADYVSISGFTVKGATGKGKAGIYLGSNIDHCNISDNNASDNNYGIYMMESSYNRITSNTVSNNDRYGIYLRRESSNYNTITSNIAVNNNYGIYLSSSNGNTISNNTALSNNYGIRLSSSSNNSITSNTVSNNDRYGIYLSELSNYNSVTSNIALNNDYGIYLSSSSSNTIHSNTASSNDFGIRLYSSCNNNHIYNNYFNNTWNNARDDGSNIWDITPTLGENILGGSWLAGNYWSDYAGIDANGDGLGDTLLPYNANGEILIGGDMHPLVPAGIAPLLALEKSDNPDPVPPGGRLDYTIIVNNVGYITTTNVTVTETYDMNVTFDSAIPAPSAGNNMWIFPALNANETKWVNISVTVNSSTPIGTVLHNIVNVTCDQGVTDTDTEATTVFSGEQNCTCGDICVITTGWWRDGGAFLPTDTPIQAAIENAGTGDTICVKDGTYTENVDVDKRLTIRSENGAASTTVNALYSNDHVFEVTADYVSISGFTVKGATDSGKAGIWLNSNIDHCNIYDNNASDNNYGIYMTRSSDNTISSNTVSNNDMYGIYLYKSSNYNSVTSNIALNNDYGIRLSSSSNNTVTSNTASNNERYGIYLSGSSNYNTITSNTVSNNNGHGIYLSGLSNYNSVTSNIALNNDYGIRLSHSSNNTISDNTASNNDCCIELYYSSSNTIHSNTASSNNYGIHLYARSNNNHIYNNYFNNTQSNARDDGNNDWNIAKTAGTNIIGGSWLAGNYWSDYAGIDANGDGLGDTLLPYNANGDILKGGDMHPLVQVGIAPLLSLEKSDKPDPVPPGGRLNYSITVNNIGYQSTTNVTVTETYDMNVTYDLAIPAPSVGNDMWIFPALNANETKWVNISVSVNPTTPIGTVLHNIVNVTCDQGVTDTDTEATTVFSGEQNCTCGDICVITTGWWRDGGAFHPTDTPIQDAIDNAGANDIICVKDGTYTENVDVDKRLTIRSENGADSTTVNALYPNDHVFEVTADYVSISGFTVKGATGGGKAGIWLGSNIEHCNISDNKAFDNSYGIYLEWSSKYHTITGNTVSDNDQSGIYLEWSSNNNTISGNTVSNNHWCGIRMSGSSYNTITSNIALGSSCGIELYYSSSNTITNNSASSNDYGIRLYFSSNNNHIYNNYFNNTRNNAEDDGSNIWNITKTAGPNIIGGSWQGGNYWSDYAGIDGNGDGLGDTLLPYNANGDIIIGGDMHPLVPSGIAPLLALEKTDDPDPVQAGDTLKYSIIVSNNGYINASAVTVTEIYDTNVTFDSAIPAPSSGNDMWLFPALNANETKRINISVTVNPLTAMGTVLHNTVNVSCAEGATDSDTEATTVFSGVPNCTCGDICVITTGWWRDGGTFNPTDRPIQDAIDNAIAGDTICVKDSTYNENVDVDKRLTIRSENGAASTTVNALYPNDHVFEVTANYVSILGFSVNGATGGGKAGIWLGSNLDHCNISDNNASDNYYGIYMSESSYNTIASNTVSNNYYCGIYMSGSNNNAISSNIVLGSSNGIRLSSSSNNNHIYNNYFNNTENNAQDKGRNIWNIAPTLGQNIIGGYWQGGNYWSDYNGIDTNGDGLGDTLLPYTSNGGILKGGDHHPLVHAPSGIELEKWVKYQDESDSEYRKAIENATICNNVTFKITIRNKGGSIELTNLIVTDVLNCRLRYINGSAIPDTTYANNCPENQTLKWTFSGLEPHEYLNITFDARIVECGNDTNYADVVAENEAGYTVVDDDTVWVNCTPPVSIETATGTGIAYFWTDSGTIEDLVAVDESTLPEEGKPPLVFPHGFFSFNITGLDEGQTVVVTILFPDSLPVGTEYWKYHASEGGWIPIQMGSDDGDSVITITLVDGGSGDDDGDADGVIVDQGGPGVPLSMLDVTKSSSPTTVAPGGTVTYLINCSNSGVVELTNVTITENYPEGVTFISAVPAPDPGTNNMWTIGVLPVGEFRTITITVQVPESRELTFTESGSVTGEGFVMVSKDLSTEQEPYTLKNVATISFAEADPITASALTTVSGVPGTSLSITEHGSGNYTSEELLNLETKNKSISLQKSTKAEYQPTSFNFSDGFAVNFTTRWMQDICSKNMVLGDAMHKKIKDATYIEDDTITETGAYGTAMEFDSSFYGAIHIGTVSKDATTSEDYIGKFELYWATREECKYLFNWSRVPGNDSENLIRFLVDNPDINFYWAENATITKSDDDRVITISTDGHSAEVILGTNNETATLKVGTETIYVLEVRTDDGNLNVYDCRLKEMSESVEGEGYVMVDKALSRGQMQVVEHGSGKYTSDMVFDSQRLNKSTDADYMPTTFNFSDNFGVNFSSKWVQDICSKDRKAGTAIHKKISNAVSMKDDTTATKSSMEFETSVNGSVHVGARTEGTRISEDYIGVFNITEKIELGKAVKVPTDTSVPDWLPCPFPEP